MRGAALMAEPKARILVVDDEQSMREFLEIFLRREGYQVQTAADVDTAIVYLESDDIDLVITDMQMPEKTGLNLILAAREVSPEAAVIVVTAFGSTDSAISAMKEGAYDYISKPFKTDEVLLTLRKAEERERLKQENLRLKTRINEIEKRYSFGNIVARSEAMARVFDLAGKVAEHKTTVLITGESGTGKELIARAIHSNGPRGSGPLVTINCAGIPETLLESELFGYKKGAFTDAVKDKPGHFGKADGGTIFLDEMGELPLSLQAKLLRVLQEEEITPLGGVSSRKIDVRVIAATSKELNKEVKEGRFREDLFYRINVMTIHLPPLRERRGDIPLLVGYFIDIFNRKLKKNIEGLSSEAMPILMEYTWPGNVRELENVIERAILLAPGRWVTPAELMQESAPYFGPVEALSIKKASKRMERNLIEKALKLTNGNRSQSSKILEISRPILISKIKEYGLN